MAWCRVRAGWHFCQQQDGCRYLVKQICVFRRVNHISAASHNANGVGRLSTAMGRSVNAIGHARYDTHFDHVPRPFFGRAVAH